jgi:hypothetical protein
MDHWGWFFDNLAIALPNLNTPSTVIMSDRQKGLNRAVQTHLPNVTEAFCCKHMERNMVGEFGKEVAKGFWRAVYARTEAKFREAMDALMETALYCQLLHKGRPHENIPAAAAPFTSIRPTT